MRTFFRGSEEVVSVAVPSGPSAASPIRVLPRVKAIVPEVTGIPSAVTAAVKVTGWRNRLGFIELVTFVTVEYGTTTWVTDPLVDPRMLPTPPNTAVTVEPPSGRDVVVKLAVPSAVNGSVASTVPPCSKLTVPPVTGVVRVLTAAVNVTGCPGWLGLPELLNRVVVSDCWAVSVTDVPE